MNVEILAKIAGYHWKGKIGDRHYVWDRITEMEFPWNPYINSEDCFDLMVKANIQVRENAHGEVTGIGEYSHIFEAAEWMDNKTKWRRCICAVALEKAKERTE